MAGFFFEDEIAPRPEELVGKNMTPAQSAAALRRAIPIFEAVPENNPEVSEETLRGLAEELDLKAGQLFGILRAAVTGQPVSPPLFESMAIIGKPLVVSRLRKALQSLESMAD